ncbi:hypothetical protein Ae406Ps2_0264 [Pseudonocardia sp. Ae406_Ps2]|uniref:hypothetical protein n=1 Tax=unclassified Pseudonocardia TaxID=2619320 RepID=UPI00094AC85A|nr:MULTISPECIES: hypothetical protein [unclassified Pseudonocardia]OLM00264.1 hypothetical protein Ae406Ps2_0264 [Pseudonocardia sp. Ae406_Ps2]OLM07942.1 hypothetical protein Ae331Ps2_5652c [Pseudonocardia sp. Ae331_Ps2]OLM21836.1 hypothetical protein Ae706Ps2_0268 [Pseudonocardia sp. Ae706_Ps2]
MHSSLPRHALTSTTPTNAAVVPVARLVEAGLRRVAVAIAATLDPVPSLDPVAHAARARRLAALHTRRGRWWAVLERSIVADHDMPIIHAQAAYAAGSVAEREARFWSDAADDWQARSEQRPTSEVAGAMSNWADLGLTEPAAPGLPDVSAVAR